MKCLWMCVVNEGSLVWMNSMDGYVNIYMEVSYLKEKKKKKNYSNSVLQDKQRLRPLTDGSV